MASGSGNAKRAQRPQVVSPSPEAHRRVPSLNVEHKNPARQSTSPLQVPHSSVFEHDPTPTRMRTHNRARRRRRVSGPMSMGHCNHGRTLLLGTQKTRNGTTLCENRVTAMTDSSDYKATLNLPRTDFPMKANLPESEPRRLEGWKASDLYSRIRAARQKDGRPTWVLHDGPPYANGNIHLGHIVNKTLKDIVLRSHSMLGNDVPFPPVWDCHGLPIELQVDKALGSKKREMDAVTFRRACRAHASKYVGIQSAEFQRLGVYGDWDNPFFTMHPIYQASIVRRLAEFVERSLVYKAKKSVHWCPSCRTALAEAEIEYDENHESPSIDVLFSVDSKDRAKLLATFGTPGTDLEDISAVAWTTTPWTIPANMALAVHPDAEYALVQIEGRAHATIFANAMYEMVAKRFKRGGRDLGTVLGVCKGATLEGIHFRHPYVDRHSPVVLADYVTLDTGTGIVHTAPGHGWDDYLTGIKYGIDIYCPVDEAGRFTAEVPEFAGQRVLDANPAVIELLREKDRLVQTVPYKHSYPICWRCKNSIIFRATAQWFIALDRPLPSGPTFREKALAEIAAAKWYPAWGEERIHNMVAFRPDWCISRQRLWGVPIPAFYCDGCEEPHLKPDLLRRVADRFEASPDGADEWWKLKAEELLPPGFVCTKCGGASFSKEKDILDVWFDSGSLHSAVPHHPVERARQSPDADLYLEGSDQHRGWFHSSLLVSVGTRDRRPFKAVLTHGFTMDGEGKKMSKSLGNVIEADKAMKQYGADVLRLWVAMVDYREDMRISEEILKRVAEAYRKIRNTCRFMLSNLFDFDTEGALSRSASRPSLESIDAYMLSLQFDLERKIRAAYDAYEYHVIYHQITQYCAVELSSFYLDVLKDRLYCDRPDSPRRRSAQYAMARITDGLARLVAPLMPFTADEVYSALHPKGAPGAVHTREFPAEETVSAQSDRWQKLLDVRALVTKALEEKREKKEIASPQEAIVTLSGSDASLAPLREYGAEEAPFPGSLASFFITSGVQLTPGTGDIHVASVARATGIKCPRCWNYHETPHDLCPRCHSAVDGTRS